MKYILIATLLFLSGCTQFPPYYVWQQKLEGEAELQKANFSKQVLIQEALAKKESAQFLAEAEVLRAQGVAKANAIIGDSLKNNEAYLRWLYIEGLKEKSGQEVIYIPTEAGLPILEAGKRK